ncbi:MAG: TonB-dependent receptor plug domain-containing protein [Bacteroidota bacterium]|nr:TonB-dependent receptor plug domain-containing protein [Bacteroidota bacterium]
MKWKILLILPFLLFIFQNSTSQEKEETVKIKGIVKTANDKPVDNAFLFVDDKIIDARTRANGRFKIKIPGDSKKLSAYTLDNRFAEVDLSDEKFYYLTLSEPVDTNKIIKEGQVERVVDLGYYRSQADQLTSSIGIVESKQGEENYYNDIYEMIKGELPGVSVVGRSITIRGPGSLRMSNEPLFVVNGTPVNSVDHIIPANVESISVLRGAAANMYGSRGSNGVIVIQLKSGLKK